MKFVTPVFKIILCEFKSSDEVYPGVCMKLRSPSSWNVQFFCTAIVCHTFGLVSLDTKSFVIFNDIP